MKNFSFWNLCLAVMLSTGYLSCAQSQSAIALKEDEQLIEFTTNRFTLPSLHVTPDKKHIIFDVLGDIYQVSIEGGKAEVILQDEYWKRTGKLSFDGKTLAYVSDENGLPQVWTYNLETKAKQLYPPVQGLHFPLYPFWDSHNHLIIPDDKGILKYSGNNGKEENIRQVKADERSILNAIPLITSVNKNGEFAYIQKKGEFYSFNLQDREEKLVRSLSLKHEEWMNVYRVNEKNNKLIGIQNKGNILVIYDLETGEKRNLINLPSLGYSVLFNQSFDFLDENHILINLDGQIVKMDIGTGTYEPIPIEVAVKKVIKKPLHQEPQYIRDSIITASVLRNPVTHPDLDTIYFGAFGKLHTYSKTTGAIKEVFPNKDRFEVSPSLSPNGKYLAYTTWNDKSKGHVYVLNLELQQEYKLTSKPGRYINPTWSLDGKEIIFISDESPAKDNWVKFIKIGTDPSYPLTLYRLKIAYSKKIKAKSISKIKDFSSFSVLPKRFYSTISLPEKGSYAFVPLFNKEKRIAELSKIDLNSGDVVNSMAIPNYLDEVMVSPDTKHVAFIYDEQVWIDSFPFNPKYNFSENSDLIPKEYHVNGGYVESISLPNSKSIYEVAPSYLYWQDKNTLMWGSADEIYEYDIRANKTRKISEIKVQRKRAIPTTKYALTNARIITMNAENEIIERGTILINGNRINKVGKTDQIEIPKSFEVIDLDGKTIIPGLIDVHAHYLSSPREIPFQENYLYNNNLAYGVTTIYDPSVNVLDYREAAQLVEIGSTTGPRILASGNIIMRMPGHYDFKTIENEYDADRIVKSNKKLGVHGPLKDYSLPNRKIRQWLRAAAKKHDMTITPDQNDFIEALTRITDGYTSIEHPIGSFSLFDDVINFVSLSKVGYTPTLIVSDFFTVIQADRNSNNICDNRKLFINKRELDQGYEFQRESCDEILGNSLLGKNKQHEDKMYELIESIKNIIEKGGDVSIGAHGDFTPGINTHWETWALTLTGLDNYQAIKAATINGAHKLDLQKELGSIEENKLADMVILNANPLEDIFNTINISRIFQNGNMFNIVN